MCGSLLYALMRKRNMLQAIAARTGSVCGFYLFPVFIIQIVAVYA